MARRYDVIILGAGNAGLGAAGVTREHGKSVAVVESNGVGGTCPLRGCVPKKVLVAAAETLDTLENAAVHHIETGKPRLDWPALIDREQSFTHGKSEAFTKSLRKRGIDLLTESARFAGPDRVRVGDETFEAGNIVIATGSRPRSLPIAGAEHLITSDDLLTLRRLPESLVFIGGGVIALEFSHVLARAGCKITILEATPRILPNLDADAVDKLHAASRSIGIDILTGVDVQEIAAMEGTFRLRFEHEGSEHELFAACVANGAGRVPAVEQLDLEEAQVEHDGPRIAVDNHLRSVSNPRVYVAGDALSGSAQLSPLATYEGRLVGTNIVRGPTHAPEYHSVPSVVFTVPSLASVGWTEAQARERGLAFEVKATDMHEWLSASLYGSSTAYAKVLVEEGSRRILGAHLIGKRAEELVHLFSFAIRHGVSADDVAGGVYAFPTFSSDVPSLV